MSYGSPQRVRRRGAADPARGQGRRVPVAAAGNEFEAGQPARVPRQPAARADRRRDRPRRQADVLLQRERRRSTSPRPASASSRRVPAGVRPGRQRRRLRAGRRHVVLGPDGRPPPSPGSAPRGPDLTPYQAAQVVRLGARDIGKPGYENATGFGVAQPARRARPRAAGRRPARAQRRHPLRQRPRVRRARAAAFSGRPARRRSRADRRRWPRTRSTSTASRSAPAARARMPLHAERRRPGPVRVRQQGAQRVSKRRAGRPLDALAASAPTGRRVRNRGGKTTTFYAAVGFDKRKRLPAARTRATRCAPAERGSPRGAPARGGPTAPRRGRRCPRARRGVGTCGLSRRYHSASSAA